jgi:hypothetical protein
VREPAIELSPIASPANATELVACSVLKKIANLIIPYAIRAGKDAITNNETFGIENSSIYRFIRE